MAKIHVEAYGCSASFADSEMISGLIINGGHTLTDNHKESDLSIVITCSVKDVTANKMMYRIKKLRSRPLVIAGCLPKAEQATVEKISREASMMGPNSIGKTLQVIEQTLQGNRIVELEDTDISKVGLPKVRLNPVIGIVEIASGCMSECTFCQTKISKGDLQSYRVGDIVRQVKTEIDDGCKEVWLTSTDNGCYGFDIGADLGELISKVTQIPADFKIRVGMMNPMYMPRVKEKLLHVFSNDKVFKFLHVPVQSGSDKVLNDMKRGHTSNTYRNVVDAFKSKFGHFTIATDIIVGYPTETQADFEETVDLLFETRPDSVNLSKFSPRPGTDASLLPQIDAQEVKRRSKKIFDLSNKIAHENNKEWIGWKGSVLFDEPAQEGIRGRNFAYRSVLVRDAIKIGEIKTVRIVGATIHSLIGEIVS